MPITNYFTVNDMLIGERTGSGPRLDYVPDALGSVVAVVDQNLNTTYTAMYKPYGGVLASTGTAPRFTWVGCLGYNTDVGVPYAEYHAGARIGSTKTGQWTSVDPLWPAQAPYAYAFCSPILWSDRTGLSPSLLCFTTRTGKVGCGSAIWNIDWEIHPDKPTDIGWIVQHVVFDPEPAACTTVNKPAEQKVCNPTNSYFERWMTVGHTVYAESLLWTKWGSVFIPTAAGWGDYWLLPGSGLLCTHGTSTQTADAKYYSSSPPGDWVGVGPSQNSCSNGLPTATAVPGWTDSAVLINRELMVNWYCCGGDCVDTDVPGLYYLPLNVCPPGNPT